MLANIMAGAQNLLTLDAVLALVAGTVGGMVIGALPGFSAAMGVSLLIPESCGRPDYAGGYVHLCHLRRFHHRDFMSYPRYPRLCRYCH